MTGVQTCALPIYNRGSSIIVVDEKKKPVGRILADDIIDAMVSEESGGLAQGSGALT